MPLASSPTQESSCLSHVTRVTPVMACRQASEVDFNGRCPMSCHLYFATLQHSRMHRHLRLAPTPCGTHPCCVCNWTSSQAHLCLIPYVYSCSPSLYSRSIGTTQLHRFLQRTEFIASIARGQHSLSVLWRYQVCRVTMTARRRMCTCQALPLTFVSRRIWRASGKSTEGSEYRGKPLH